VSLPGELRVVEHVPRAFSALVVEEAPASLALSGGSTAHACYELLAVADIDWSEVEVFFGDERWVPVGDPESNEGRARHAFVDQVSPRQVHSMRNAGDTIEEAADAYDRLLRAHGPLDFVHLGLGPDGHTASLVPGDPVLDVSDADVAVSGEYQGRRRMTLTYPALNRARRVLWLVTGAEKSAMFARLKAADQAIPAGRVRQDTAIILADRDAAAGPRGGRS
jgi:6-phosphogluconolactonase